MRDHVEPQRYYDWMLYKMRQYDNQDYEKMRLEMEYDWLLKLDRGGYLCTKYPDLKQIVSEVLITEKLTNEQLPKQYDDDIPF